MVIILCFLSAVLYGQNKPAGEVKYTHDFKFKDGIYATFDQVKQNNPIPKYKILTNADYHDTEFFDKVLKHDKIYYFDDHSVRKELKLSDIWGYSRNGVLHIRVENEFDRVTIVGGICHFVATVTTTDTRYVDPYYNPYNPYNYYNYYNYYGSNYYPRQTSSYSRTEMQQFILDFETGKVLDYNVQNLEIALMRDPELYDEYMGLKSRKKKQLKFFYIRKFNERNPVYFPKNP